MEEEEEVVVGLHDLPLEEEVEVEVEVIDLLEEEGVELVCLHYLYS